MDTMRLLGVGCREKPVFLFSAKVCQAHACGWSATPAHRALSQ